MEQQSKLRKHLQELPTVDNHPSDLLSWDPSKTRQLLSGMGVALMDKEVDDTENTPHDMFFGCLSPPPKRQKCRDRKSENAFVIARRPRQNRRLEPGVLWESIPDELLLGIFFFLPLTDLLKASLVCKRWHRLVYDESLWHSIDLADKTLNPGAISHVLSAGVVAIRCPRSFIGETMFKDSRPLRLQHADLSNCQMTISALEDIFSRCRKLVNLSLEGMVLSDDIIRCIGHNSGLRRLNLCGCSGFTAEALEVMITSCTRLEELNLSWCDFTPDHIQVAANNISESLTQLNLSGYRQNLLQSDVQTIIKRCRKLINIDFSDSVMLTSDCLALFHELDNLQHLSLSRCYHIPSTALT
ncbi:S-phase kinase-associated protein 2 isoform X2 [Protopterus annectens]|nr:S-phase kinase-associated protein 2 isoform X2 [Protopterus annectens]